jgi:hypothetical protein
MIRSRFTEEQIIAILRQQESGVGTSDVAPAPDRLANVR